MFRETISLFLMPVPFLFGVLVWATWRRRRRLSLATIGLLWVLLMPITSELPLRLLESRWDRVPIAEVSPADVVLVLSGGVRHVPGDPDTEEFDDLDRFLAGLDLYKANKAPRLMFTAGWSSSRPDRIPVGDAFRRRAVALGIPHRDIVVTGRASTTAEEAQAVADQLSSHSGLDDPVAPSRPARIILVTSAFHMTRALSIFTDQGLDVEPFPVDFRTADRIGPRAFLPSGSGLPALELALHECAGWVLQRFRHTVE